ncbi:DNA-directed RNA polymerase subunit beta [Streptomyces gardneri]|nr:DNA-directed RNA polymerase subunit beta [Streptomyces gardneri]
MTPISTPVQPYTESPHSRSEFYRRMCSLPTVVDPQTGRITMKTGSLVGAVMMPTGLAQQVKNSLDLRGVAPLSIIGHPRAEMWTFLVRADMQPIADPGVTAQLWHARVVVIRDGYIALPSPVPDPLMIRTWISPATGTVRPSGEMVIECARAFLPRTARR